MSLYILYCTILTVIVLGFYIYVIFFRTKRDSMNFITRNENKPTIMKVTLRQIQDFYAISPETIFLKDTPYFINNRTRVFYKLGIIEWLQYLKWINDLENQHNTIQTNKKDQENITKMCNFMQDKINEAREKSLKEMEKAAKTCGEVALRLH